MMLEHLGEIEKAERIKKAIADVVEEGKVRTYDMMRLTGSEKVLEMGAASTEKMTDAIISKME
jgi:3-isopropylmalate dehydrogenase